MTRAPFLRGGIFMTIGMTSTSLFAGSMIFMSGNAHAEHKWLIAMGLAYALVWTIASVGHYWWRKHSARCEGCRQLVSTRGEFSTYDLHQLMHYVNQ